MDSIEEMAAKTALDSMFKQGYFSICTIDKVAKVLNVSPKGRTYDTLAALHCVGFDQMPGELRDAIPGMIRECLSLKNEIYEFDYLKMEKALVEKVTSPMGALIELCEGVKK